MKIYTSFKFQTPKEQIETEVLILKKSWDEAMSERKEWNKKYGKYPDAQQKSIEKAYGILVSFKIYNQIRSIYLCDHPFPHDTKDLFGLKVGIMKGNEAEIMIVDKKEFDLEKK